MPNTRVRAVVNLDAIAKNTQNIKKHIETNLCAVIKADAYGHGALETARVCLDNGANLLAVAICEEGVLLKKEPSIQADILVLAYTPEDLFPDALDNSLQLTVFSLAMAKGLAKTARKKNMRARVHIKIDTGMGRLGFLPNSQTVSEIIDIFNMPNIEVLGIYTHFATSDETGSDFVYEQVRLFEYVLGEINKKNANARVKPLIHAANSGAVINYPDVRYDFARTGITLFGLPPANHADTKGLSLIPAMDIKTRISSLKDIKKGVSVGYARSYVTKTNSRIATLPVGYADGYPRNLSNKSHVLVNGQFAPVIGNICMDQMMIDVTGIPIKEKDEVTLLGKDGSNTITACDLADMLGTINYEIICRIGMRIPREYTQTKKTARY